MLGCVKINTPLEFKLLREKLRSLLNPKINSQLTHSSKGSCSLCNIYKFLLKVTFFVHFYFLGSPNYRAPVSSKLQYQILSLQLCLLRDEACPLIQEGHRKYMDIQDQTPAKSLIIQFHLHLLTNKQCLAKITVTSRYCTSHRSLLI